MDADSPQGTQPPSAFNILCIGEALFDRLPEGDQLGGAPLNTAVHCKQLLEGSIPPATVSIATAVGSDPLGDQLKDEAESMGLNTGLVQTCVEAVTGTVDVTFDDDGDPVYAIAEPVAWDYLQPTKALLEAAAAADAVCFGSLAQRNDASRAAIQASLARATNAHRLYDVNLRPGLQVENIIRPSLHAATMAKFGEDELMTCLDLLGMETSTDITTQTKALLNTFALQAIILTRGSRGTAIMTQDGLYEGEPAAFHPEPNADPIGAGDSVGATALIGTLLKQTPTTIAGWANQVGAHVASRPGATPKLSTQLKAANFLRN